MGISPTQLLIILLIVAVIFGTKKLRNVGGDFGAAFKNFKKAMSDETVSSETGTDSKSPNNDIVRELIEVRAETQNASPNKIHRP